MGDVWAQWGKPAALNLKRGLGILRLEVQTSDLLEVWGVLGLGFRVSGFSV